MCATKKTIDEKKRPGKTVNDGKKGRRGRRNTHLRVLRNLHDPLKADAQTTNAVSQRGEGNIDFNRNKSILTKNTMYVNDASDRIIIINYLINFHNIISIY